MPREKEKKVLIVSNSGAGIKEIVERKGFNVVDVVPHDEWSSHIGTMEECFLVVLDEVDQFISCNLRLSEEEDRVLLGEEGPFVLVLAREDDFRLDERAKKHIRWRVHHKPQSLAQCLEEMHLARPQRHSWCLHIAEAGV